ncbi:protein-export chaperone SecB, partial [Desulfobacterales bacterium HSG16]|nr:protein-export chaperone SecB [Desulfobacterales bacterium HSG16]
GIRNPQYIKSRASYISGLNLELDVFSDNANEKEAHSLINVKAGISGLFKVKNDRFLEENEKKIVLIQFPALLLPYLRSAITGLIANAGLGTFIFPLINLRGLIKDVMENTEIQTIE